MWQRITSPTLKFQGIKDRLLANKQRQLQEQLDVFNLYLYTALQKQSHLHVPEHVIKDISAEVGTFGAG